MNLKQVIPLVSCILLIGSVRLVSAEENSTPIFNGKDLSGWCGRRTVDPAAWHKMSTEEKQKITDADNADMEKHWKVEDGEIVNDGHGVFLTTEKEFGDFELSLEWKMVNANTDSGIYLRGYPQVQIWDPTNKDQIQHGNQKGSGGLWNNHDETNGKFPLVKADKPVGEWNEFVIRMVDNRVTIHFNGKLVVDNATLDNYFSKTGEPIVKEGPIQLQTHGGEMRFRKLKLKELSAEAE